MELWERAADNDPEWEPASAASARIHLARLYGPAIEEYFLVGGAADGGQEYEKGARRRAAEQKTDGLSRWQAMGIA